jgi:cobalt/nickel transport system permease protein
MVFSSIELMHVPDGFLSTVVSIVLWIVAITAIASALKRVSSEMGERLLPVMGVLAAAIFAGQMLNFSVAGGTSGHLLGAALATIVLGPWGALLVMTSVVSIQALIFQDGGLLALGANLVNMGVIGVAVSHFVYRSLLKLAGGRPMGLFVGAAVAAWFSIVVASLACAIELAASGTSPANLAIPAMAGIHALIGLGEAVVTVGAVTFLYTARRDLLEPGSASKVSAAPVWVFGALISAILVGLAPLASSHPDGLEWVAEQQGFLGKAREPFFRLIPDYALPGLENEAAATILAGAVGILLILAAYLAMARQRRKT